MAGRTQPMFPATGSTNTAAIESGFAAKRSRTLSRSLYSATRVIAARAAGTPGESGAPKVRAPLPALTRKESPWPW